MKQPVVRRPMVGRAAERSVLDEELRRARSRTLRCVLIEGEPGIGKTRLATDFVASKRKSSAILSARGYPFGSSTPFGLWAEAFDGYLRGKSPEEVDALCGGSASDLEGIVRSAAITGRRRKPANRVRRPLEGMATLLHNVSADRTVLIHFDDMHLADSSSWEALDYIAHNLSDLPVLIVLCARTGELAGRWAAKQVLLRLEQEDVLRRIALRPLDVEEITDLVSSHANLSAIPAALISWLFDRSRGNPLFAVGLLDALIDQGADVSEPELASVPSAVSERALATTARLDTGARSVLETLAVIGREAEASELTIRGGSRDELETALTTLLETGLIESVEQPTGARYRIVHPLIQEAIYESVATPRRRSLHRRVARDLVARGRLAEAAPHLVRSAEPADAEAIDALGEAARAAWSANAFEEAFEVMNALFELIPPGDKRGLDVLDLLSAEGEWTFHHKTDVDYSLCVRVLRKAERLVEAAGDRARLAALNLQLASFLAWGKGDLTEAERRGTAAAAYFDEVGDQPRALMARNELAWIHGITGDFDAQERAAASVVDAAEKARDRASILMALSNEASTQWPRGRFREAEGLYRRCIEMAVADGNTPRLRHGDTLLAMTLALQGRLIDARACIAQAEQADPAHSDVLILEFGPHIEWFAGDMAEAQRAAQLATSKVGPRRLSFVTMIGALASTEIGDLPAARSFLLAAEETDSARRRWLIAPYLRWAAGMFAWRTGDPKRALDELERASSRLLDIGALPIAALVLADLVDVAMEEDFTVAARAAQRLTEIADALSSDLCRAIAATARAQVNTADSAASRDAVELLAGRGYLLFEARAHYVLGRAIAGVDRAQAVQELQASAALFKRCRASWREELALDALRELGKPGRRAAAKSGELALTRREREVADLAIQGLSAKEIGQRLYIGERTVETHLANAYAKLGVRTKAGLMRLHLKELPG